MTIKKLIVECFTAGYTQDEGDLLYTRLHTATFVANKIGKNPASVCNIMNRMAKEGVLIKLHRNIMSSRRGGALYTLRQEG